MNTRLTPTLPRTPLAPAGHPASYALALGEPSAVLLGLLADLPRGVAAELEEHFRVAARLACAAGGAPPPGWLGEP